MQKLHITNLQEEKKKTRIKDELVFEFKMKTIIKLNSCNSSLHMSSKNYILTKEVAQKKLQRMAYEILERNEGEDYIILAGIKENGLIIAKRMKELLLPIYK